MPNGRFGSIVKGAGDLNNDGFEEIIVFVAGATSQGGPIHCFSGIDGSILYSLSGGFSDSVYTEQIASGAGDVNNDGFDDFITSKPSANVNGSYSGTVEIYSGLDGSVVHTIHGTVPNQYFGAAVSDLGDLDGDGFDDVIVSSLNIIDPLFGTSFGEAQVFSGFDASVLFTFSTGVLDDYFGLSLAGPGDVDNDGTVDILIGAPLDGNGGTSSGSARVFSGTDGSLIHMINGTSSFERFAAKVAATGDVNSDGHADFMVNSARNPGASGTYAGSVEVFSGLDGSILFTFDGDPSADAFGSSISSAGDTNGDGIPDLLVGAYLDDDNGVDTGEVRVYQLPAPLPPGPGQANSSVARLEVNQVPTGNTKGPFTSDVNRGQFFTLHLSGSPYALFDVYASATLNPAGWDFGPFGLFDLGTGPTFDDVFVLVPGLGGTLSLYPLDVFGNAQVSFFVHPSTPVGPGLSIQALIQNPQPWVNGHWGTLTATHQLVVQ